MPLEPVRAQTARPARSLDAGPSDHVIVCGLRELGLSVVEQFSFSGVAVVVVDDQPDHRLLSIIETWGVDFVHGSARSASALTAAGVETCQALICVEDHDLYNLETALVARELRPDLRVVVQMSNAAVARALTSATGPGTALDVADLASPAIVQACLGEREHEVVLSGEHFSTLEVRAPADGTLRALYGDLVPIAVLPGPSASLDICPGRDRFVHEGDRIVMLGMRSQLDFLRGETPPADLPAIGYRFLAPLAHVVRALWRRTDRGLRYALGALFGLVVASMLVIHFAYHPVAGPPLDLLTSLYFTVETIATVGFGDFSFARQPPELQVFGIVLIIVGASLVTAMFALLTNLLVSRTLAQALGNSRGKRMRNHVVVVGLGAIGLRVVERLLSLGHAVVVIERDEDNRHLRQAKALRVPIVLGDATQAATLELASARHATAVAVLTSNDLTNLETAISLGDFLEHHEVDPPVVVRLFDRTLARTVTQSFGLSHVRSTTALAAPWFVGAALGLDIVSTFSIDQDQFLVARLTVAAAGGLAGLEMQELEARIRVIAIRHAGETHLEHPPRRSTRFAPGDQAWLIGPYEQLLVVLRRDAHGAHGSETAA